jgi:hypothetical protein
VKEDEMALPTNEQLSKLGPEALISLWRLVREYRMKLMGLGPMPVSAIEQMCGYVGDKLMADIVSDNRKAKGVPAPSGLIPDEKRLEPVVRGSGWQKSQPLDVPPGTRWVDQLCDVQDAIDKAELRRRLGGG